MTDHNDVCSPQSLELQGFFADFVSYVMVTAPMLGRQVAVSLY